MSHHALSATKLNHCTARDVSLSTSFLVSSCPTFIVCRSEFPDLLLNINCLLMVIVTEMKYLGFVLCLCVGALGGKYSREINEQDASVDGKNPIEFRIAKLNQVWEKAIRVSNRIRLIHDISKCIRMFYLVGGVACSGMRGECTYLCECLDISLIYERQFCMLQRYAYCY